MWKAVATGFVLSLAVAGTAAAQARQYVAYIGPEDLVNSNGDALTAPWQVIRQDRANYHRFGIRNAGDQSDPLFHDPENRALMEQYVQQGRISPQAARDIMRGGATIVVHISADVRIGQWVEIDVYR